MTTGRGPLSALFCFAVLLCSASARGQNNAKRCYTVDETFYKIHDLKLTPTEKVRSNPASATRRKHR